MESTGTGLARLRPVAERDLGLLERFMVEPELIGPYAWFGYADRGAVRRRFETDGYLTEDYGRLMVDTPTAAGPASVPAGGLYAAGGRAGDPASVPAGGLHAAGGQAGGPASVPAGGLSAAGGRAGGDAVETVGLVSWIARLHGPPPVGRCLSVGIGLLPHARNRGIGTAAQRALAEYLFATTPVMRLEASTVAENLAEQRALDKAGFTREGVLRRAQFIKGDWRDLVVYSRLRTD